MTCSPARLAADRANALRSTGPKTPEGKAITRRNGLKHGLTGEGIALPDEDAAEVDRRFAAFESELAPSTELGRTLTRRLATLAVRLERCGRNEAARLALAVDSARSAFDDRRRAEVEHLLDTIHDDPATNARRLQRTPEGVALTVDAWRALGEDLAGGRSWDLAHRERAENLMGRRPTDLPRSRIGALSDALSYGLDTLEPAEAEGLDDRARRDYARGQLVELVEGRIARLTAFRAAMDLAAHDRARALAPDRALFDASAESVLARKYEAAAERSLFRTLRELREVEAEAASRSRRPAPEAAALGSSLPEPAEAQGSPAAADPEPSPPPRPVALEPVGAPEPPPIPPPGDRKRPRLPDRRRR